MSIKAIFPAGVTELTVHGLHQWDYGREIEIHADNLPGMVEVHFACSGMDTAVVRSCALIGGAVTAAVPDICLEQTTPTWAWVYAVGETSGETILTIKLPITQRTKPHPAPAVPEKVSDKYTEAIGTMATLVEEGRRIVGNASSEIDEAVRNASSEIDEAVRNASSEIEAARTLKLTGGDKQESAQLEYTITETGLYLVLFKSAEATITPVSSLILIRDLEEDARGTSAYSCAPAEYSTGGWDFGTVHYVADEKTAPARKHVLSVYHPKGNCQTSGYRAHLMALYKLADV